MSSIEAGDATTLSGQSGTEFDLRLPHLNITGVTDSSTTKEPLLLNLLGNVEFRQWQDFDNLMSETLESTKEVAIPYRVQAQKGFDFCRHKVNKLFPNSLQNSSNPPIRRRRRIHEVCYAMTPLYENRDPRKRFRTSTSVGVFENIFSGLLELLSGLWAKDYDFDYSYQGFPLMQASKIIEKRSPIPDRSLCTVDMDLCNAPPVCAFELKGPAVQFANVKSYGQKRDDLNLETALRNRGCQHEVASEGICCYLNHLFGSLQNFNTDTSEEDINKGTAKRVAQTLVQAMTCSSGCGFLYNYEVGIAFEILKEENNIIIIRTSSLFCCGNQKGAVAAMLTMANHAVKKLRSDKESSDRVHQCVNILTGSSGGKRDNRGRSIASNPGTSENPPNDSGLDKGATQTNSSRHAATHSCFPVATAKKEIVSELTHAALNEDSDMSDVTEDDAISGVETQLNSICKAQQQVMGSGRSGMVFSSSWNGKRVALKMWNGEEEWGLLQLRREIEAYKYIRSFAPALLGTAVPGLVLGLDTVRRDGREGATVALVTDYVGEGLSRDVAGELWVSEGALFELVGAEDKKRILDAALQGMEALHRSGIIHGDISLRNLRVESGTANDGSDSSWKAWWIDLGQASFGLPFHPARADADVARCASLFEFDHMSC